MQNNTENDIDQHITTLLNDILAPTNCAELKGVLKTVDLLTDYVRLENVRTILEDDVLFRENRDVAVMALDILRKMHDNERDPEYDACETEVVDAVNEALGQTEPEIITLTESLDDAEDVVAVAEPETTPEPAEVEATTIDVTETQPEQTSHETQKTDTVIEIPVSSYAVSEDSDVPDTADNSVGLIDSQTTEPEPEPVTAGSGFPGLPDDEGLSDLADSMDGETPELGSEPASPVDFPGLSEDSDVSAPADTAGSPFGDDPDQMPAFPDDGDMSGLPEPAESNAGGELEHQWNQTVQRIKELKTRYVTK